jgi:uncharacterized protein YggU (UPF0235/DUF167 family)
LAATETDAWRTTPDGLRIFVRVTPKGGRDALDGIAELSDGRSVLKVRVRAAPEDGAANAAVAAVLAKSLGVAKSAVSLAAGHTARLKTLDIAGEGAALGARLAEALKGKNA